MLNQYPAWKNLLILLILLIGGLYALANLFGEDPAVQISADRGKTIDMGVLKKVEKILQRDNYQVKGLNLENQMIIARFKSPDDQLKALDTIKENLGTDFLVALNLASGTPGWLKSVGGDSMSLGLDLRGGVHFLMEVDSGQFIATKIKDQASNLRTVFRKNGVAYLRRPATNKKWG